jgi:hypothetical protein
MASFDSLQSRKLAAKGVVLQCGTDGPVAVRMRYKGTGTVTSVTVITGTSITMITSDGGTDAYAFATYDTVAKLVSAINADNIFEAKALDTLGSYATATQFVNGAIASSTLDGITIWDMKVDTSAAKYLALRLTSDRGFQGVPAGNRRVHLNEAKYFATLGNAAVGGFKIVDVKGSVETVVLSNLSVSAAATTESFASGWGYLTAEEGHDLVVVLIDDTSVGDAAANYLVVSGIVE